MGLTMEKVWGKGLCVGRVPPENSPLCAYTAEPTELTGIKWIIPEMGGWWVCSRTGLTPCLHISVFNPKEEFCILVAVVPKILYHPEKITYDYWAQKTNTQSNDTRQNQERTYYSHHHSDHVRLWDRWGTDWDSSLVPPRPGIYFIEAIDEDITRLEESISHLEKSLTSLSEMVLQN